VREVLQVLVERHSTEDIAARLRVTATSVGIHREHLMQKLCTHSLSGPYEVRDPGGFDLSRRVIGTAPHQTTSMRALVSGTLPRRASEVSRGAPSASARARYAAS